MSARRHFADNSANILVYFSIDGNASTCKTLGKKAKLCFTRVGCKCQKMIVFLCNKNR